MATTFKTFLNDDVASTRTLLHEAVPVTGSILFGTYPEPGLTDTNIKTYTHGMFQSVYDYSYTKSSANHIFDLTVGYSSSTSLTVTSDTYKTKKQMIYNEFAKILAGHDETGAIRLFDEDGDLTAGDKINDVFVISVARLLNKDEIKKGSFYMDLDVTSTMPISGSCGGDSATAATGEVAFTGVAVADETVVIISTDGTSVTYTAKAAADFANNEFAVGSSAADSADSLELAIEHASGHNGKITVSNDTSGTLTLTQASGGTSGNTTITEGFSNGTATDFTGGTNGNRAELRISDSGAATAYKTNSPAGEYGILKCDTYKVFPVDTSCADGSASCEIDYTSPDASLVHDSDATKNLDTTAGLIFYQAGVVVLNAFIFERYLSSDTTGGYHADGTYDGRLPPSDATDSDCRTPRLKMDASDNAIDALLNSQSLDSCATALRKRINKIAFNNTTELNSTIYFCRANHNDFNYSSNPTYLTSSKIRVKENQTDAPVSYITTVGLYSADNELLAVAKLSEPLRKDPTNEMVLRVRLDY